MPLFGRSGNGAASGDGKRKRVLVVDDIPQMAASVAEMVRGLHGVLVEVVAESDPRRAVERLAASPFDLVVADAKMPYLSGPQVLLAARTANAESLLVLMDAFDAPPDAVAERAALGLDAFLRKPIRGMEVHHVLLDLLQASPETIAKRREERAKPVVVRPDDGPPETQEPR